jgi:hypothetical protein
MRKLPSIALATCIAALLSDMPNVQAKQCSAAMPSNPHGRWWSYRLIDGRKCWYEGKPMLSRALLEWPKEASADAQARPLKDADTFEVRWRERVDAQ